MKTIEYNNIKYEYTYESDDLYDIIGFAVNGDNTGAAKRCTKLLRHVENNEVNAFLRVQLGNLILGEISKEMAAIEEAKNSPVPSPSTPLP